MLTINDISLSTPLYYVWGSPELESVQASKIWIYRNQIYISYNDDEYIGSINSTYLEGKYAPSRLFVDKSEAAEYLISLLQKRIEDIQQTIKRNIMEVVQLESHIQKLKDEN